MSDNITAISNAISVMTSTLRTIAARGDCEYLDVGTRPSPCDCPHCVALAALAVVAGWRHIGARPERCNLESYPREAKIHAAWVKGVPDDRMLAMILGEHDHWPGGTPGPYTPPSARDWFVATTVVQWLATNVGRCTLEAAGFMYQDDDTDYKARRDREDAERREQDAERAARAPAKETP